MNYKTTLFLLVLLALVSGFFYWARQQHPATNTRTSKPVHQDGSLLFDASQVNPSQITSMELTYPNQTIKLEHQNQNWVQTQPIHWPINAQSITQLLQAVQSVRQVESFAVGQPDMPKPQDIGLNPPMARLTLFRQNKSTTTITLGRLNLGNRAYLMLDEQPTIYVVSAGLHELLLNQSPTDWRVKTLELPALGETSHIQLHYRQHLSLLTQTQGRWLLQTDSTNTQHTHEHIAATKTKEMTDRTNLQTVSDLLSDATGILLSRFVADNPADPSLYGLDTPALSLAITQAEAPVSTEAQVSTQDLQQENASKSAVTYTLQIGSPTDLSLEKHFACWSRSDQPDKVVFELAQSEMDKLSRMPDDFRDQRLMTINPGELRQITFAPAQKPLFALAWTPSGWIFSSPSPTGLDESPLSSHETSPSSQPGQTSFNPDPQLTANWINALFNARAIGFRVHNKTALATPSLTLHLTDITTGKPHTLRLFSQETSPESTATTSPKQTNNAQSKTEATETQAPTWIAVYDEDSVARIIPQSALPMVTSPFDFYAAPPVKMP